MLNVKIGWAAYAPIDTVTRKCSASKHGAPALLFAAAVYICITTTSGKKASNRAVTDASFGQIPEMQGFVSSSSSQKKKETQKALSEGDERSAKR